MGRITDTEELLLQDRGEKHRQYSELARDLRTLLDKLSDRKHAKALVGKQLEQLWMLAGAMREAMNVSPTSSSSPRANPRSKR